DTVTGAHDIARDRLVLRDQRLGIAAEIDIHIAAFDTLDHAGDQLADTILPGIDDLLAFGFAHTLHDDLLGSLGGDTAEIDVLDLFLDVIAHFDAVGLVDRIHQADLPVRRFHDHVIGHDFPAAEGFVAAI